MNKYNIESKNDFVKISVEKHGDFYDYSKTIYESLDKKVEIVCSKHGPFFQKPRKHILGQGCPKCKLNKLSIKFRLKREKFIEKAKAKHNNKFDYSKVGEFNNTHEKVTIICPYHGDFIQEIWSHLCGNGCPSCGLDSTKNKLRLKIDDFINRSRKIHNNKYDYSNLIYKNNSTKVSITCHDHGEFTQNPASHLKGFGCPICSRKRDRSLLENKIKDFLNKNNINFEEQKTWDWLYYKKRQRVDFYLPDHKVAIECQGKQHFESGIFKEDLSLTIKKDQNKKNLCEENNIKVIYFSNLSSKDKKYSYPYEVIEDLDELLNLLNKIGLTN